MREEIDKILNDKLDNVNPTLDDIYNGKTISNNINNKVEENNNNYRTELINILDNLKKMGVNINYNNDMSIEELENILSSIKA